VAVGARLNSPSARPARQVVRCVERIREICGEVNAYVALYFARREPRSSVGFTFRARSVAALGLATVLSKKTIAGVS